MIHVVHATAWYPPHHLGGTEIYVEGLIAELRELGFSNSVLIPKPPNAPLNFEHQSVSIETYPVDANPTPDELKRGQPHRGFEEFRARLTAHRNAMYHQHSWSRGCGPAHLRAAREAGLRTVLTVHVPGYTCLRGTMLKFGERPCDGLVEPTVCGACWAQERGLPKSVAHVIGHLPSSLAARARQGDGRMWTATAARTLAEEKLRQISGMISDADRIVAVCQWVYDVLVRNGIPRASLVLSRQGIRSGELTSLERARVARTRSRTLRLLLLARWDPVKGIDIAVQAIRKLAADVAVELRICAVPSTGDDAYERRVRALAAGDSRIRIEGAVSHDALAHALSQADALVVPSTWMETGPLVVLEALAAGLFVIGSRLGGIAELVDEGDCGCLVEPGDIAAWSRAISIVARRHAEAGLPETRRPLRTMASAAADMAEIYACV